MEEETETSDSTTTYECSISQTNDDKKVMFESRRNFFDSTFH